MSYPVSAIPVEPYLYPVAAHNTLDSAWNSVCCDPIDLSMFSRPVTALPCGDVFSLEQLEKICGTIITQNGLTQMEKKFPCPLCRTVITSCLRNRTLEQVIEQGNKILQSHGALAERLRTLTAQLPSSSLGIPSAPVRIHLPQERMEYPGLPANFVTSRPWMGLTAAEMLKDPEEERRLALKNNTGDGAFISYARLKGLKSGGVQVFMSSLQKELLSGYLSIFGYSLDPKEECRTTKNEKGETVPMGVFTTSNPIEVTWACNFLLDNNIVPEPEYEFIKDLSENPTNWRVVEGRYQHYVDEAKGRLRILEREKVRERSVEEKN